MKIDRPTLKMLIALVVMAGLFVAVVIVPTSLRNSRNQARIDKARDSLGLGEVDESELQRLRKQVQQKQQLVKRNGQEVPDEQDLPEVLRDISGLISATGVTEQQIVTNKVQDFADYSIMPVKMQFNAPFATAFDLLKKIETMKYVVRIDSLNVNAETDYPAQPLMVDLELSAFYTAAQGGDPR